jgi:hypothetical protein
MDADQAEDPPPALIDAEDLALDALAAVPCDDAGLLAKLRYMIADPRRLFGFRHESDRADAIIRALRIHFDRSTPQSVEAPTEERETLLAAYDTWLDNERRWLAWERAGDDKERFPRLLGSLDLRGHRAASFHGGDELPPSSRAETVLAAVGCRWRD